MQAVFGVGISLDLISSKLATVGVPNGGVSFLIDQKGELVASSDVSVFMPAGARRRLSCPLYCSAFSSFVLASLITSCPVLACLTLPD